MRGYRLIHITKEFATKEALMEFIGRVPDAWWRDQAFVVWDYDADDKWGRFDAATLSLAEVIRKDEGEPA